MERLQPRQEKAAAIPGHNGNPDRANYFLTAEIADCGIDLIERTGERPSQRPRSFSQLHPLRATQEQLCAQPLFQRPDLVGNRRMGHAKLVGSIPKTLVPGGGFKGPELVQRRQATVHLRTRLEKLTTPLKYGRLLGNMGSFYTGGTKQVEQNHPKEDDQDGPANTQNL